MEPADFFPLIGVDFAVEVKSFDDINGEDFSFNFELISFSIFGSNLV